MTPADMAALHAICFATPRPWSAPEIAAFQTDALCFTLIDSEAFLIGRAAAGEAEILTLAVAPQARRRGIGHRLITGFLYQARLRGATRAHLEVSAENAVAIALYAKAGFVQSGLRKRYYASPDGRRIDAIVMLRALI